MCLQELAACSHGFPQVLLEQFMDGITKVVGLMFHELVQAEFSVFIPLDRVVRFDLQINDKVDRSGAVLGHQECHVH